MTAPEIYRDDESGDFDVFVPQTVTGELIEFLRGRFPYFGVTIEADVELDELEEVESDDDGANVEAVEDEVEEHNGDVAEDADDLSDDEPLDAFSFPGDIDPDQLAALLQEFFHNREL